MPQSESQQYFADLDRQLRELKPSQGEIPVFSSKRLDKSSLASKLAGDIGCVLRYARLEWPDFIRGLSTPVPLRERYLALCSYSELMHRPSEVDPVLHRAKTTMMLYFDHVYFRNEVLERLRRELCRTPGKFGDVPYLSAWLELVGGSDYALRLKTLRHAVAHGTWCFTADYSGIVACDQRQKDARFRRCVFYDRDQSLMTAHYLLHTFTSVFMTVVKEEILEPQNGSRRKGDSDLLAADGT